MPKRKSTTLSHEEAIADILNWFEEEDNEDDYMPLVENNDDDDSCSDLYEGDIVQSDDEDFEVRRPSRKLLTKNKLVHDIDSSLNEECYDDIHCINGKGQWARLTGYLGPKTNKNTKTVTWTSDFPTQGTQRDSDIINIEDNPGTLLGAARNTDTIDDAFNLLFDDQMLDLLVRKTNDFIERKLQILNSFKERLFESSKYPYLGKTSLLVMCALIDFMYIRDLYGLNHHKIDIIFSAKTRPPIFGAIFSRNQVNFLLASISFISRDECIKNYPEDSFAFCRPIFVLFNANCSKYLVPMLYMAIDETLYQMRYQIAFKQYNPNKPYKHGLL